MNCLKDHLIQKYIDGETSAEESERIRMHIEKCDICSSGVESQWKLSARVKKAFELSATTEIEIPQFELPGTKPEKFSSLVRMLYVSAAASIILFLFVTDQKKEIQSQGDLAADPGFSSYVNANCPVSRLPLVINVNDGKGNITEFLIE